MPINVEWMQYDVVVVGSGGAESRSPCCRRGRTRVLMVSKDPIGCSDTKISEGIATVRGSGADDD